MSDLGRYVGIPYVRGGASFAGADCFGIVQLYYRNEYGIDIERPVVYAQPIQRLRLAIDNYRTAGFELAPEGDVQPGDVVMLQHGAVPDTFAVALPGGKMLSTATTTGSVFVTMQPARVSVAFRHGGVPCA